MLVFNVPPELVQKNRGISYLQFYFLVLIIKDVNNEIKIAA